MPQVWLTYEELGELLDCEASAARDKSVQAGWTRRQCRDGLTRVKLLPAMAHEYMTSYVRAFQESARVDRLVAPLRDILQQADEGRVRRGLRHIAW